MTTPNDSFTNKAGLREFAARLREKGKLYLWDEPDKYYAAEILKAPRVDVFPGYTAQGFILSFICEPFAYRDAPALTGLNGAVTYNGTVEAPFILRLNGVNAGAGAAVTLSGAAAAQFSISPPAQTADIIIDTGNKTVINANSGANLYHLFTGNWEELKLNRETVSYTITGAASAQLTYAERFL